MLTGEKKTSKTAWDNLCCNMQFKLLIILYEFRHNIHTSPNSRLIFLKLQKCQLSKREKINWSISLLNVLAFFCNLKILSIHFIFSFILHSLALSRATTPCSVETSVWRSGVFSVSLLGKTELSWKGKFISNCLSWSNAKNYRTLLGMPLLTARACLPYLRLCTNLLYFSYTFWRKKMSNSLINMLIE